MGLQRDQIEQMHEETENAFYRKALDHPYELTKDGYLHVADSIHDIIRVAAEQFNMPHEELMQKLYVLREHAAHDHVIIDLDYQPDTIINEGCRAGLLRTLNRTGRENS